MTHCLYLIQKNYKDKKKYHIVNPEDDSRLGSLEWVSFLNFMKSMTPRGSMLLNRSLYSGGQPIWEYSLGNDQMEGLIKLFFSKNMGKPIIIINKNYDELFQGIGNPPLWGDAELL